jgi:2'-5' RNA ligase
LRLFTAIELDDPARVAIAAKQTRLRKALGDASMKWVRTEQMHLTLVFIGHVADDRVPAFIESMQQSIPQRPFRVVFAGTGVFPPHGAPRVLWLGTREGAELAVALQQYVAGRLEPLGVARESRAYSPHLTLARWRVPRSSDRRRVPADDGAAQVASVEVGAVTLFESRLSSSGPAYHALARGLLSPC